jgi:hypothetical protein
MLIRNNGITINDYMALRLFWALKWQRAKRVPFGPTTANGRVMDLPASKSLWQRAKRVSVHYTLYSVQCTGTGMSVVVT